MKKTFYILTSTLLAASLIFSQGCGDKHTLSAQQVTSSQLESGTWKIRTATAANSVDVTSKFSGFTIKFSDKSFTTTNGGVIWSAIDTWIYKDAGAKSLIRGDGVPVTIESLTNEKLVLSFPWASTTYVGGRVNSISGSYQFELVH